MEIYLIVIQSLVSFLLNQKLGRIDWQDVIHFPVVLDLSTTVAAILPLNNTLCYHLLLYQYSEFVVANGNPD